MTTLLSREKEFRMLNEQLDKWATAALHPPMDESHEKDITIEKAAQGKTEERFYTYTKGKGPSTLLKKRAAAEAAESQSDRPDNLLRNGRANMYTITGLNRRNTTKAATLPKEARKDAIAPILFPASLEKGNKSTDTPTPRTTKLCSTGRSPRNDATFTVKYRNPKFVACPSLEALIKEEAPSIKETDSNCSNETDSAASASVSGSYTYHSGQNKKFVSKEGLIKFLKSKVTILEQEHTRTTEEMVFQKEQLEKALERQRKTEQQRDSALSRQGALSDRLTKLECQLEEYNRRVKEGSLERLKQQKSLESTKHELKKVTQKNSNLEKRLHHLTEELETAKSSISTMKNTERELKDKLRDDHDSKDKQIKSLKKQRADLLNAYKKQLYLIDNLKRQTLCMEQAKLLSFGEKEFAKVLEWNDK